MAPLEQTLSCLTLVTILLLFSSPSISADSEEFRDRQLLQNYLQRTIDAVERALNYIGRNYKKLNFDGTIGVRKVESKLAVMVSYVWIALPQHITKKVRNLVNLAREIGDEGEAAWKRANPKYYEKSYPLIRQHFWDLMFPDQPINSSLIRILPDVRRQQYTMEKESNDCLAELFGTDGHVRCRISRKCWTKMTGKQDQRYSLTHEVFYLLNGIYANCHGELEQAAQKYEGTAVIPMLDFVCSVLYNEALSIEKQGFPAENMDLFMEQIGLCSDAGYIEIAKWKWLPRILSLQRPNGCFGALPGEKLNPLNFDPKGYGKSKRSFTVRKRVEQLMSSDGCLSHRISVALSALVGYVRRLMQDLTHDS